MPSAFGDITGHRHQCQQNASGREAPKQNDGKTFFTTRLAGQKYFILSLVSQVALWNLNEGTLRLLSLSPFNFEQFKSQFKVVTFSFFPLPPSILGQWSLQFAIPQRCSTTLFASPDKVSVCAWWKWRVPGQVCGHPTVLVGIISGGKSLLGISHLEMPLM